MRDKDLERILRLYEIIKRYEFLVEYLLTNSTPLPNVTDEFDLHRYLKNLRITITNQTLEMTDNNISKTAKLLNISRPTLYDWLEKNHRSKN